MNNNRKLTEMQKAIIMAFITLVLILTIVIQA